MKRGVLSISFLIYITVISISLMLAAFILYHHVHPFTKQTGVEIIDGEFDVRGSVAEVNLEFYVDSRRITVYEISVETEPGQYVVFQGGEGLCNMPIDFSRGLHFIGCSKDLGTVGTIHLPPDNYVKVSMVIYDHDTGKVRTVHKLIKGYIQVG